MKKLWEAFLTSCLLFFVLAVLIGAVAYIASIATGELQPYPIVNIALIMFIVLAGWALWYRIRGEEPISDEGFNESLDCLMGGLDPPGSRSPE